MVYRRFTRKPSQQWRMNCHAPRAPDAGRAEGCARLIRKVYEADPLECPRCQGPMRLIALIEEPGVMRRILEHLGRWAPEPPSRSPPVSPEAWPAYASLPLTYPPVPDIG